MLPWSVTATAGIPSSRIRLHSSGHRFAPSSREYWRVEVKVDEVAGHPSDCKSVLSQLMSEASQLAKGRTEDSETRAVESRSDPSTAPYLRRCRSAARSGPFDATMVVVGGIIGSRHLHQPLHRRAAALLGRARARGVGRRRRDRARGRVRVRGARQRSFRRPGGEYVYLREAYHPGRRLPLRLGVAPDDPGGRARGGRDHVRAIHAALRRRREHGLGGPLAIAAIALVAAVNYVGVKPGSRLLNVLVVAEDRGARGPDRRRAASSPIARPTASVAGLRVSAAVRVSSPSAPR